jgi:hypothetical protein
MKTQNIIKGIVTGIIFVMTVQFSQAENTKPINSKTTDETAFVSENELGLENWMVDTSFWKNEESEELHLENWMTDTEMWETDIETKSNEQTLHVESWMLDTTYWNNTIKEEVEQELDIENWMVDTDLWK